MQQLESMTFFNSQRFPYAHIDLSGNTIVVGTNGIGKTSSLRAALFFYGVSDRLGLGIRSDNKLSFGAYFLQDINSYIFFTYTNAYGRVLLMVYRPADKIRYRFAMLDKDVDLREVVLDIEGSAYVHDDIVGEFLKHSISMSDPVMSSDYREIIYGTDKVDSKYKRFSLFRGSKDYAQLPATLSSIFVNSTVKSSSVQGALSGCIEGATSLGLFQFRRQIDGTMDRYRRIQGFEAKSGEIQKVLDSLNDYGAAANNAVKTMRQLLANAVLYLERKNGAEVRLGQIETEIKESDDFFKGLNNGLRVKITEFGKNKTELEFQINDAEAKQARYIEAGIEQMLYDYERLEQYRITLQQANNRYAQLVGDNQDIANGFDRQIENEGSALEKLLSSIDARVNALNSEYNSAVAKVDEECGAVVVSLKERLKSEREELQKGVEDADTLKQQANEARIAAQHADPKKQEREVLKDMIGAHHLAIHGATAKVNEARRRSEKIKDEMDALGKQRAHIIERQEKLLAAQLAPVNLEIKAQEEMLDIREETLLGQIRSYGHPNESELAALLKDDILLNDLLSPRYDAEANAAAVYGISIDTSGLDLSRYDQSVIKEKIKTLNAKKAQITKAAQEETDRIVGEIDEKVLQKRKESKELDKTIADEEPKAKESEIAMLQAQSMLNELNENSVRLREEAVKTTEKHFFEAKIYHESIIKKLNDYDREMGRLETEIRDEFKKIKLSNKKVKDEKEHRLDEERSDVKKVSAKRVEKLREQKVRALEEGGVSTEELAEAEREKNMSEQELGRVNGYRGKIEVYKNDKAEYIDKIPSFQERLKVVVEKHDSLSQEQKKREEEHNSSLERLRKEKSDLSAKHGILTEECKKYESFKQENLFEKYGPAAVQSAPIADTEDRLTDLIYALRQRDMEVYGHISNMRVGLNEVFGAIGDAVDFFGLERPGDTLVSLVSVAGQLSDFINDGRLEALKEQIAQGFLMTHRTIAAASEMFVRNSDDVRNMVTKMNTSLRDLSGIKVVESVQVRYAKSENPTLALLEKMREMDVSAGFEATLFNPAPDVPAATVKMLEILENISKAIDKEKCESLSLSDSFSLEFRVVENGRDSNWLSSLDDIGSNGTDVLVKTMIYVAMLDMVLTSAQRNKSETRIHVLLDEVGVLAQSYLRELIEFANARSIFFFNGAPDPKIPGKYNATYTIRRESAITSSVLPTARKL